MIKYFKEDGEGGLIPCPAEEGMSMIGDPERTRVAFDEVGSTVVSTIFLPIDYSFGMGAPIHYETKCGDSIADRYRTRKEALAGHKRWVAWAAAEQLTNDNYDEFRKYFVD